MLLLTGQEKLGKLNAAKLILEELLKQPTGVVERMHLERALVALSNAKVAHITELAKEPIQKEG